MKRLLSILLALLLTAALCACAQSTVPEDNGVFRVVATDFPAYDRARTVCGDAAEVTMLLPPGTESHSYEPTPRDILTVQDCDLFLYVGGESDAWVDTILDSLEPRVETLRMVDCVELLEEEELEGMTSREHHHEEADEPHHGEGESLELDEHVWTSPTNYMELVEGTADRLSELDPEHGAVYTANRDTALSELAELDREFRDFFAACKDPTLVFGDRFPLRYFAEEYGLTCYAAFPGCSTQTEPSAATVAFLTDLLREQGLSTVYYIEFSNHLVADSIAEAAGAETALFHSCHNVSRADLEAGATYLSLMRENLQMLQRTMK